MKNKVKYFIFIFLMLVLIKIPNVCAKGKVEIESIDLIDKSENTIINSEPTINDLNTSFNIGFKDINDYAKYKIVVNNTTDEDYEISDKVDNSSEYITYEYSFENNDNVVKKNSKLVVFVTIKYNKELPSDKFENGQFNEDNNILISLSNDTNNSNTTANPDTSDKANIYLTILILSSIAIIGLILTKKTHDKKYLSLLIISLALIPTSIYALKKIEITISAKTTIFQTYRVNYLLTDPDGDETNHIIYVRKDIVDANEDNDCNTSDIYTLHLYNNTDVQYIACTRVNIMDTKKYLTGERVNTISMEPFYFTRDDIGQRSGCRNTNECHISYVNVQTYHSLTYEKTYNPSYAINDIMSMNFESTYTIQNNFTALKSDNSFTITNHDVIFSISIDHSIEVIPEG